MLPLNGTDSIPRAGCRLSGRVNDDDGPAPLPSPNDSAPAPGDSAPAAARRRSNALSMKEWPAVKLVPRLPATALPLDAPPRAPPPYGLPPSMERVGVASGCSPIATASSSRRAIVPGVVPSWAPELCAAPSDADRALTGLERVGVSAIVRCFYRFYTPSLCPGPGHGLVISVTGVLVVVNETVCATAGLSIAAGQ